MGLASEHILLNMHAAITDISLFSSQKMGTAVNVLQTEVNINECIMPVASIDQNNFLS